MEIAFVVPSVGLVPKVELLRRANAFIAVMDTPKIALFTDGMPAFDDTVVLADLAAHQCAFSGYPADGIVPSGGGEPYWSVDDEGYRVVIGTVQFNRGVGATSENAAGFYAYQPGEDVFAVARFEEPQPMETTEDSIPITLVLIFKA